MSILIWIIILVYLTQKISVALLHLFYVYSHYRYQRTCATIASDAPSQEVGHWELDHWGVLI